MPNIKISRHLTFSRGVDFFWNDPVEWCTGKYTRDSGRIEPQTFNQLYNISFYWSRPEKTSLYLLVIPIIIATVKLPLIPLYDIVFSYSHFDNYLNTKFNKFEA